MNYTENRIWKRFKSICTEPGEAAAVEKLCKTAVEWMKTVRDTFPRYTLHDEVHVGNVLFMMDQLLEEAGIERLTVTECEMLILAACYHDIGMCYSEKDREKELKSVRFRSYLERNPWAYLEAAKAQERQEEIPLNLQLDYFRSIHHIRVMELLPEEVKNLHIRRDYLIEVCKSHGEDVSTLGKLRHSHLEAADCVFCAILLRLADVLDFDFTRSPDVLYQFQDIGRGEDGTAFREWRKHMSASGFRFHSGERRELSFQARCEDMQNEHVICEFLDYIEKELKDCREILEIYGQERWRNFLLPEKIEREIQRLGYQTGEYCLTLDADRVLHLLVGNDIYISDTVFVRELLQNAFDAVKARRMMDRHWAEREERQVCISSWYDCEGSQWFRIDDSGIGMTEYMILEYFLKVGRSYYQSDEFKKNNYKNGNMFQPISQFGIGILSCFLKGSCVEVSTRHYQDGPGIRFHMPGIKGYYSIAKEELGNAGSPMPAAAGEETENFRQTPGTSIAVRLHDSITESMKRILEKYICYPDVKVCYKDGIRWEEIYTEQDLMQFVKKVRGFSIPVPKEFMAQIKREMPYLAWEATPKIVINCIPLDEVLESPYITGGDFEIVLDGRHNGSLKRTIGQTEINRSLEIFLGVERNGLQINIGYNFEIHCVEDFMRYLSLAQIWDEYRERNEIASFCAEKLEQGQEAEIKECLGDWGEKDAAMAEEMLFLWQSIQMEQEHVHFEIPFSVHPYLEELAQKVLIPRCNLESEKTVQYATEIAFNGIRVAKSCYRDLIGNFGFQYTVVLLSGRYQPVLGISRDRIRYFPIEASAYLELLGKKIGNSGLSCSYGEYSNLVLRDYQRLFEDRRLLQMAEETLEINLGKSIADLKEELQTAKEPIPFSMIVFYDIHTAFREYSSGCYYFSALFLRAIIQKEFEVRWTKNENGFMTFLITGIRSREIGEAEQLFWPLMFAEPLESEVQKLTESITQSRQALNAAHPFSVWFLEYAVYLNQKHNSIFKKIRGLLCDSDAIDMIGEVNILLKELERRSEIRIPDDVWLKKEDFIYFR